MATGTINQPGWRVIYTNPDVSNDQAATSGSVDLSGYTEARIEWQKFKGNNADSPRGFEYAPIPGGKNIYQFWLGNYKISFSARLITVSSTGYSIGNCQAKSDAASSSAATNKNSDLIVTEIAVR